MKFDHVTLSAAKGLYDNTRDISVATLVQAGGQGKRSLGVTKNFTELNKKMRTF